MRLTYYQCERCDVKSEPTVIDKLPNGWARFEYSMAVAVSDNRVKAGVVNVCQDCVNDFDAFIRGARIDSLTAVVR